METAPPFFLGKFGQKWETIPQDFSKIIEHVCSRHSLTTFYLLQPLNNCISYVIPNRDWKLLCMCVYKYIYTIYTYTYLKKHAFPLPPLYFLIILFCIKTYCLSINISFPSEFRISRISDSNFFFMGFTPLCSYSKYFYVK